VLFSSLIFDLTGFNVCSVMVIAELFKTLLKGVFLFISSMYVLIMRDFKKLLTIEVIELILMFIVRIVNKDKT